jgi:seryl-tRNA synthetase
MPMFETARGTRMIFSLPPTPWEEFEKVSKAYRELAQERQVTSRRVGALVNDRERAIHQDRDALARAIREGKPDPGNKKIEQIEKETEACRRRVEALELALDDAESEIMDVLDEHRSEWAEEVRAEVLEAQAAYAEAVEAVAAARHKVSMKFSLLFWIEGFPDTQTSYRVRGSYVGKLKAQNGDPYIFDQVVEALREDAQPAFQPVEEQEVQHASPLQPAMRKG